MSDKIPSPLNQSLERLLAGLSCRPGQPRSDGLILLWRQVAGTFFIRHSSPTRVQGETLFLAADGPHVRLELLRLESELLFRLNERGGLRLRRLQVEVVQGLRPVEVPDVSLPVSPTQPSVEPVALPVREELQASLGRLLALHRAHQDKRRS